MFIHVLVAKGLPTACFGHLHEASYFRSKVRQDVVADLARPQVALTLGQGPEAPPGVRVLLRTLPARCLVARASYADRERTPARTGGERLWVSGGGAGEAVIFCYIPWVAHCLLYCCACVCRDMGESSEC